MSKTLNQIGAEAYETAKSKGFYDSPRTPLEFHALIHSEISEAVEEIRADNFSHYYAYYSPDPETGMAGLCYADCPPLNFPAGKKPLGELSELADAVIRIADYCAHRGYDLDGAVEVKLAYNKTRPFRHGGKKL